MNGLTLPVVGSGEIAKIDAAILQARAISHAALMEEAAAACVAWLCAHFPLETRILLLCGAGNNGGDGLVMARRLFMAGYDVCVYAAQGRDGSLQAQQYARTARLMPIRSLDDDWAACGATLVVDALFGVGLRGALRAPYDAYIRRLNALDAVRVAIDMPSGLGDDAMPADACVTQADVTLSLCAPKLSQLWAVHERFIGDLVVLPLASAQAVLAQWADCPQWLTPAWASAQVLPLQRFAHKGNHGRVALAAGSVGMVGAAILAASACVRSGAGLTTVHLPEALHAALHAAVPEVMLSGNALPSAAADVLALGCGWGQEQSRRAQLSAWLAAPCRARVIDADALNVLAAMPAALAQLPGNTVLTPHPREFARLTGRDMPHDGERITQARAYAKRWQATLVLKGKYSVIAAPDGRVWVNPSGHAALAKGGSGDVLTGMVAAYLAQGYAPEVAAALAVYRHGLAAERAVQHIQARALSARDVIAALC